MQQHVAFHPQGCQVAIVRRRAVSGVGDGAGGQPSDVSRMQVEQTQHLGVLLAVARARDRGSDHAVGVVHRSMDLVAGSGFSSGLLLHAGNVRVGHADEASVGQLPVARVGPAGLQLGFLRSIYLSQAFDHLQIGL